MSRPRFSVSSLLGLVAVVACLFAALRYASPVWTNLVATATLLLLLSGVAGACFATGLERAFWGGFALFGITYLVLVNWDWVGGQFGHDLTGGLSALSTAVFPPPAPPITNLQPDVRARIYLPPTSAMVRHEEQIGNFVQMARMVLSLVIALVGGLVSRRFAARAAARSD